MRLFGKRKVDRIDSRASGIDFDDMPMEDEFGDIDDHSQREFQKSGARGPVLNVLKGAGSGMKTTITNPSIIRQKVMQALPPEARYITDTLDTTAMNVRKIYADTTRDLKPVVGQLAKTIDKLVPAESRIAKKVSSAAVNFFSEKRYDTTYDKEGAENSAIEQALGGIFQAQSMQQAAERNYDKAEEHIKDGIEKKRFEDSMTVTAGMSNAITRLATYTETINQAFQKKSLELGYRQYFLQNDMFKHMQEYDKAMKIQGDAIVRNTGLPEFEKLNMSERFRDKMKSKTFDSFLNGALFNGMNNVVNTGFKNIGNKVSRYVSSVKEMLEQGALLGDIMSDQLLDERAMEESGMGGNGPKGFLGMVASFGGEWLMNQVLNLGAEQGKEELDKAPKVLAKIMKYANMAMNPNNTIRGWERSEFLENWSERGGLGGTLAKFAKTLMANFRPDVVDVELKTAGSTSLTDMKEPAVFDNKSYRTLNDIIPAYLASMLYEAKFGNQISLTIGAAGSSKERIVEAKKLLELSAKPSFIADNTMSYDFVNERLISKSDKIAKLSTDFAKQLDIGNPKSSIEHLAKMAIGTDSWDALTEQQKSKMRNTLLNSFVTNEIDNSVARVIDPDSGILTREGIDQETANMLKLALAPLAKDENSGKQMLFNSAVKSAKQAFKFPLSYMQSMVDTHGTRMTEEALGKAVTTDSNFGTMSMDVGHIATELFKKADADGPIHMNMATRDSRKDKAVLEFLLALKPLYTKIVHLNSTILKVQKPHVIASKGHYYETKARQELTTEQIIGMMNWCRQSLSEFSTKPLTVEGFDAAFDEALKKLPSDIHKKQRIGNVPFSAVGALRNTPVKSYHFNNTRTGLDSSKQVIGPMAQDVNKSMGEDAAPGGTTIDLLTVNGVTMQAVKELDASMQNRNAAEDAWGNLMIQQQRRTNRLLSVIAHQGRITSTASAVELGERGVEIEGSRYYGAMKRLLGSGSDLAFMAGRDVVKGAIGTTRFIKNEILIPGADKLNKLYDWAKPKATAAAEWTYNKMSAGAAKAMEIGNDLVTDKLPKALKWSSDLLIAGKNKIKGWYNFTQDLYLKNKPDVPALKKEILRVGGYFIQETGDVITSIRDIAGTVVDKAGNVILNVADYKDGFFDDKGQLIKEWVLNKWGRLKNGLGVMYDTGRDLLKGSWDLVAKAIAPDGLISRVLNGIGNFVGGTFGIGGSSNRIYNVLLDIRDIMRRGRKTVDLRSDKDEAKDSERKSKHSSTLRSLKAWFTREEEIQEDKKQKERAEDNDARSKETIQDKVDSVIAKADAATGGRVSEALAATGKRIDGATGGFFSRAKASKNRIVAGVKSRTNTVLDRISGKNPNAPTVFTDASKIDLDNMSLKELFQFSAGAIAEYEFKESKGAIDPRGQFDSNPELKNMSFFELTKKGLAGYWKKAGLTMPDFTIDDIVSGINLETGEFTSKLLPKNAQDNSVEKVLAYSFLGFDAGSPLSASTDAKVSLLNAITNVSTSSTRSANQANEPGKKADNATGGFFGRFKQSKNDIHGNPVLNSTLRDLMSHVDKNGKIVDANILASEFADVASRLPENVAGVMKYWAKEHSTSHSTYSSVQDIIKNGGKLAINNPQSVIGKIPFLLDDDKAVAEPNKSWLGGVWNKTTGAVNSKDKNAQESVSPQIPVPGKTEDEKQKTLKDYWDRLTHFFKPSKNDKNKDGKRDGNAEDVRTSKELIDGIISGKTSVKEAATVFKGRATDSVEGLMSTLASKSLTTGIGVALGTLAGGPLGGAIGGLLGMLGLKGVGALGSGALTAGKFIAKNVTVQGLRSFALAAALNGGPVGWMAGAAAGALGLAGTVLASPIGIPLALAAGAGVAVYYANEYQKNMNKKWHLLRFAQYGFSGTGDDVQYHDRLRSLENLILDKYLVTSGGALQIKRDIDVQEVMMAMGVDGTSTREINNFHYWFHRRFKPFFLNFFTAFKNFGIKNEDDIEKLEPEKIKSFKEAVAFNNGPYNQTVSPFPTKQSLPNTKDHALSVLDWLASKALAKSYGKSGRVSEMLKEMEDNDKNHKKAMDTADPLKPYGKTDAEIRGNINNSNSILTEVNRRYEDYHKKYGSDEEMNAEGEEAPDTRGVVEKLSSGSIPFTLPRAPGSLMDPSGGLAYISVNDTGKVTKLVPEFQKLLFGMAKEYSELTGKKLPINQGYRSYKDQETLYNASPKNGSVARPGHSMHEVGVAVDIPGTVCAVLENAGLFRKYGLTRPLAGESWHVEPAGLYMQNYASIKKLIDNGNFGELGRLIDSGIGKGGGGIGSDIQYKGPKYSRNSLLAEQYMNVIDKKVAGVARDQTNRNAPVMADAKRLVDDVEMGIRRDASTDGNPYPVGNIAVPDLKRDQKSTADAIAAFAKKYGVESDIGYLTGLAYKESGFKSGQTNGEAVGLTQMVPSTAAHLWGIPKWRAELEKLGVKEGYNLLDPNTSLAFALVNRMASKESLGERLNGVNTTPGIDAMIHMLGQSGSKAYIQAIKDKKFETSIKDILPNSVISNGNKNLFFDAAKNSWRTLGEVIRHVENKLAGGRIAALKPSLEDRQLLNRGVPAEKPITAPSVFSPVTPSAPTAKELLNEQQRKTMEELGKPVIGDPFIIKSSSQSLKPLETPQIVTDIHSVLKDSLAVQQGILSTDEKLLTAILAFIELQDPKRAEAIRNQKPSAPAQQGKVAPAMRPPVINLKRSAVMA